MTTGAARVLDCPEVRSVLGALDELAEDMDERRVEIWQARLSADRRGAVAGCVVAGGCD
ncbi:MAG: hypothetical protein ACYSU0_10795 [Planctomycetota bacterium]